jgi:hypothetical protein
MNGRRNLWIVKPGGMSRGRNIMVFNKLNRILEYTDIDVSIFNQVASNMNSDKFSKKTDKSENDQFAFSAKKNWVV